MLKEFKEFIARGNVFDMAVGIVMGAAFTAIVNSAVADLVMPLVGVLTSGVDFGDKFIALNGEEYANLAAAKAAAAPILTYGVFVNAVINFFIVSFVIFMLIKQVNRLKKKEAAAPSAPPAEVVLLTEIRDLLKK
ncbi:MAG TPA: large conductance mechanosensitive channel protein MscL [Micavibrio sp.]|jgi:large conductance mechanosensitive channel|nr:large conductance mechanosensitive channel protein MscL [Micavibrio sp.]